MAMLRKRQEMNSTHNIHLTLTKAADEKDKIFTQIAKQLVIAQV